MALILLQAGREPLGQFDGYDADTTIVTGILGGEVATLVNYAFQGATAGTDQAAKDADGSDGYVGATSIKFRPIATRNMPSGARPVFLMDEGSRGYGTLFGEVIGGIAGKKTTGVNYGPHTAEGSGKVTLWDKPGLYGVTLNAVDTNAVTGLTVTNPTLDVGDPLYARQTTGVLTPNSANAFDASLVVARFVEFSTNGSLVNTPNYLVAANQQINFTMAVFHFDPED
jgi:hypothetical protein